MATDAFDAQALARLSDVIDAWADSEHETNPLLSAVQHEPAERRWYVRLRGEDKAVITVWLTLRQRTLACETYFMPAPEENVAACYEYLLRANATMFGLRFAVGLEDAIYLMGQVPVATVDEDELDRLIGEAYAYSERYFRPAMAIGYASRFA